MKVVIYGKPNCPFCVRAKDLCEAKGIDHEYIDFIAAGMSKQDLEAIVGKPVSTVPQILVDGVAIGGYTDLVPLAQKHQEQKEVEDPNMNYFIRERGEGDWVAASFKQYLSANSRYEMDAKKEPKGE